MELVSFIDHGNVRGFIMRSFMQNARRKQRERDCFERGNDFRNTSARRRFHERRRGDEIRFGNA